MSCHSNVVYVFTGFQQKAKMSSGRETRVAASAAARGWVGGLKPEHLQSRGDADQVSHISDARLESAEMTGTSSKTEFQSLP